MIKINLLPSRVQKRKRDLGTGGAFVGLLVALILIEVMALYLWHGRISREAAQATAQASEIESKVQRLQQVKLEIEQDEEQRRLIDEQNRILAGLRAGKTGPPNMLLFIAYALTKPADTLANRDELKAMESAGWNTQWDPDSVWLTRLREDRSGLVTLYGEARTHEDAAEFWERMHSSIYFRDVEPRSQERRVDQTLEMNYIAFEGRAMLNYEIPSEPVEPEGDALDEYGGSP